MKKVAYEDFGWKDWKNAVTLDDGQKADMLQKIVDRGEDQGNGSIISGDTAFVAFRLSDGSIDVYEATIRKRGRIRP